MSDDRRVLTGARDEHWEWRTLDLDGREVGTLDGVEVTGGTLEWSSSRTIKGGGKLTYTGDPIDWLTIMLQPVYYTTNRYGSASWPLGVFIPASPADQWDDTGVTLEIDLYDKLQILDQDKVDAAYTVAAGSTVVDEVTALIQWAAVGAISVDPSDEVTSGAMAWDAGTTRLRIINDLLDSINYFSLWVDGHGVFRVQHYTPPSARGARWDFRDDYDGIYDPGFTISRDSFNVPNKIIEIAQPGDDDAVLVAEATNEDPESPYSYSRRGRWIAVVEEDVEASSQAVLNAIAQRRLNELSSPATTIEIKHALVPLDLNDAVTFRASPAGVDVDATVQSLSIDASTGGLVTTSIRKVVT